LITETLISPYRCPDKPAVVMPEETLVRVCVQCRQSYTTNSRVQKRCASCRVSHKRAVAVKASAKLRAKRARERNQF
jgi:hypothetical protein